MIHIFGQRCAFIHNPAPIAAHQNQRTAPYMSEGAQLLLGNVEVVYWWHSMAVAIASTALTPPAIHAKVVAKCSLARFTFRTIHSPAINIVLLLKASRERRPATTLVVYAAWLRPPYCYLQEPGCSLQFYRFIRCGSLRICQRGFFMPRFQLTVNGTKHQVDA